MSTELDEAMTGVHPTDLADGARLSVARWLEHRPAPLPDGHTAAKLAAALRTVPAVGEAVADRAARGFYHDYLSPLAFPELALSALLAQRAAQRDGTPAAARMRELRQQVIDGEFDATKAEGDAWMASPEGRAAWRELLDGE